LAANVYEGMFILDSNHYGRDPEAVSKQVPALIEALGGEVLVSRLWEERRLAYPIKGHRKGTYWLTYFRLDSNRLTDLNRQCQITEDIIRFLFLVVEPRIVDALVSHALSAPTLTSGGDSDVEVRDDDIEDVVAVDAVEGVEIIEDDE
jgi:small subunit ribosomal protein S6